MNISPMGGSFAGAPVSGGGSPAGGANGAKIKELEKKLEHLNKEKKEAEKNHDTEKAQKLSQEILKVEQQLEELKRKEAREKEEKERDPGNQAPGSQAPPDGVTGQYINTWA